MIEYFSKRVIVKSKMHAIKCFPEESCGLVIKDDYTPCDNIATNPLTDFKIDTKFYIKNNKVIEAIIHSHNNFPHASKKDMLQQISTNIPWGLVNVVEKSVSGIWFWGDQLPTQDLIGRSFAHGIYDCYALVRSYYRKEFNITLPIYPREEGFWRRNEQMFTDNFENAGFIRIERKDIKVGDVVLGNILSNITNHSGIYVGDGLILHHLVNRLSRIEPLNRWSKHITHYLRYKGV